jgi:hypothetical protein
MPSHAFGSPISSSYPTQDPGGVLLAFLTSPRPRWFIRGGVVRNLDDALGWEPERKQIASVREHYRY